MMFFRKTPQLFKEEKSRHELDWLHIYSSVSIFARAQRKAGLGQLPLLLKQCSSSRSRTRWHLIIPIIYYHGHAVQLCTQLSMHFWHEIALLYSIFHVNKRSEIRIDTDTYLLLHCSRAECWPLPTMQSKPRVYPRGNINKRTFLNNEPRQNTGDTLGRKQPPMKVCVAQTTRPGNFTPGGLYLTPNVPPKGKCDGESEKIWINTVTSWFGVQKVLPPAFCCRRKRTGWK